MTNRHRVKGDGGRFIAAPAEERFWSRVLKQRSGCWLWLGKREKSGYGRFVVDGKEGAAHRFAYEYLVGPIPDGRQLDHLCRNTGCVNPHHLEPVTPRENVLRGDTLPAANAAKSSCKNGHPLSGDNLYRRPDGNRACKECRREAGRRHDKRRAGRTRIG